MSDATDAIIDIQEALLEYGSDIILKKVTKGTYDPDTGEDTASITDIPMQALPRNYNRKEMEDPNVHIKDKEFRLYYNGEIDYDDKIEYKGKIYSLERIDTKDFQNEELLYTIQGRV